MTTAQGNAVLIEALGSSLRRGGNALEDVPGLIKRVLQEDAWREFATPRGELVRHERFVDFVTTPPSRGLGASIALVRRIISADTEAVDLLDQATQRRRGHPVKLDNIQESDAPSGTSRQASLRRLRKDRPDLHTEVLAGRLSAHAAMVQAGFRRKSVSIPVGNAEDVVRALRRNLDAETLAEVGRLIAAAK